MNSNALRLCRARALLWIGPACLAMSMSVTGCRTVEQRSGVSVGKADVDITPPVGYRMAGYFDERLSTGVHDPLLAKAVVLRQENTRLAFVFCDVIGIPSMASSQARKEASRRTGIPFENIMVCCTHTHTGPLFEGARRDFFHETAMANGGTDPKEKISYVDFLTKRIAEAIVEADSNLEESSLFAGEGRLDGFSFNRRYHMTNGTVQTNPGIRNPGIVHTAGPVDTSIGILQAKPTAGGNPSLTVSVFALHCDTTGGTEFGGDYPFFLAETLREKFGASHMSAFAAGTCGDINHIDVSTTNRHGNRQIGTNLAGAVMETGLEKVARPSLAVRSGTVIVPLRDVSPEQVIAARARMHEADKPTTPFLDKVRIVRTVDLAALGHERPVEVQVFRIDSETALVCLPGEVFVELGLAIKRESPFKRTFVLSICNDRPSYFPTLKAFQEGGYEIENARVKPGGGEKLVATAVELLKELK